MRKHWQCCSGGARPEVLSVWCPFFTMSLKVLNILLSRHPVSSCPVGKFSTTSIYFKSNSNVQWYETSMNCFKNLKKCVIYLPPLMFPKTGHCFKGHSRDRHELHIKLLESDVILKNFPLFLPKIKHFILKFKFVKAQLRQALVKISAAA